MLSSNLRTFLEITEQSFEESERISESNRRSKPNSKAGYIITYDPKSKAFKHALISIDFAGIYFEALLYVEGCRILGQHKCDQLWKKPRCYYETKLGHLGIRDEQILAACARFRLARNDLIHEKAVDLSVGRKSVARVAQEEAQHAIEFIKSTTQLLKQFPGHVTGLSDARLKP
jgi:hypothetical protein